MRRSFGTFQAAALFNGVAMLKTGSRAPDFTLKQIEGPKVTLSGLLSDGGPVLLVFLRHLV
jgi:peroxiredoxin